MAALLSSSVHSSTNISYAVLDFFDGLSEKTPESEFDALNNYRSKVLTTLGLLESRIQEAVKGKAGESLVYKRKDASFPLPMTVIISRSETTTKVIFLSSKFLGKGEFKRAKEAVLAAVPNGLDIRDLYQTGAIGVHKVAVCIRKADLGDEKGVDSLRFGEREWIMYNHLAEHREILQMDACVLNLKTSASTGSGSDSEIKTIYNVHPLAECGSLFEYIRNSKSEYAGSSEPAYSAITRSPRLFRTVLKAYIQGCRALELINKSGLIYSDFKAQNILGLDEDTWVLGDLESIITKEEYVGSCDHFIFTDFYVTPECIRYINREIIYTAADLEAPEVWATPLSHDTWTLSLNLFHLLFFGKNDKAGIPACLHLGMDTRLTRKEIHSIRVGLKQKTVDQVIELCFEDEPFANLKEFFHKTLRINPRERISLAEARILLEKSLTEL